MPVTIVGNNTPTAGGVVYGDGTNYASTAAGSAGQVLLSNGASAPSFGAVPTVNLATGVTGTLPVANGGTGATSLTANNVLLGNGTSAVQVVAPGTNGNVLMSNGTTWTSAAVSSGALTLISTTSANGTNIINITSGFNSTYDDYLLIGENITFPGTGYVGMRLYTNGTARSSSYSLQSQQFQSTLSTSRSTTATEIGVTNGSDSDSRLSFFVYLLNANSTSARNSVLGNAFQAQPSGTLANTQYSLFGGSYTGDNFAVNGVQFIYFGGNPFSTFTLRLYGVAK